MKILNKIFVLSLILIPMFIYVCINTFEQNVDNAMYIFSFISAFILIVYDIVYVILFLVLKIGRGVDRINLFNRKDD